MHGRLTITLKSPLLNIYNKYFVKTFLKGNHEITKKGSYYCPSRALDVIGGKWKPYPWGFGDDILRHSAAKDIPAKYKDAYQATPRAREDA